MISPVLGMDVRRANGVPIPDLMTRDRDSEVLHATAVTVEAMTASRMTPATMSGWDNMIR